MLQVLILVVELPVILGFDIVHRRRLRRAGQPVPRLLTAASVLFTGVGVLDATGVGLRLTDG